VAGIALHWGARTFVAFHAACHRNVLQLLHRVQLADASVTGVAGHFRHSHVPAMAEVNEVRQSVYARPAHFLLAGVVLRQCCMWGLSILVLAWHRMHVDVGGSEA
jgi:hypothetical protein